MNWRTRSANSLHAPSSFSYGNCAVFLYGVECTRTLSPDVLNNRSPLSPYIPSQKMDFPVSLAIFRPTRPHHATSTTLVQIPDLLPSQPSSQPSKSTSPILRRIGANRETSSQVPVS